MKNKLTAMMLVMLLIFSMAALAACGGGSDSQPPDNQQTEDAVEDETDQGEAGGGNKGGGSEGPDFSVFAAKSGEIKSFYYKTVYTFNQGESFYGKMWLKGNKMRMESVDSDSEETVVTITDNDEGVMYIYYPESNYAMKMDMDFDMTDDDMTPDNFYDSIEWDNYLFVDKEVLNGMKCVVYRGIDEENNKFTVWIWEDWGMPVKIVSEVNGETMTVEYTDIELNKVDDSVFKIPGNVEIMDFMGSMG